jgi:hypothetical protein
MPLFLIERTFAEQLQISPEGVRQIEEVNDELGVEWLFSFLSADSKKTYCLYEAKNLEAVMEQARVLGLPADVVVEVSKIDPREVSAAV